MTPKRLPQRALLTQPFLAFLDTYHRDFLQGLQSFYPMTLLKEGLEVERLKPQDEDRLFDLYTNYFEHLRLRTRFTNP